MDIVFKSITCNRNLPIWVVENSFALTCYGGTSERCHFDGETIVEASGRIVMNGFEDYADDDSMVMMQATMDTMAGEFDLDQVVDLCMLNNKAPYVYGNYDDDGGNGNNNNGNNDDGANNNNNGNDDGNANYGNDDAYYGNGDDAYVNYNGDDAYAANNNGDDAYANNGGNDDAYNNNNGGGGGSDDYYNGGGGGGNDDAAAANNNGGSDDYYNNRKLENGDDDAYVDGCPEDGIYDFTAYMTLPSGKWRGTGWGANGYFDLFAHDGTLVGSCTMKFATPTTAWYVAPSSVFWGFWVLVVAVGLFYFVFFVIKREMLCNNGCIRISNEDLDEKSYKKMSNRSSSTKKDRSRPELSESSTDSDNSDRDLNDSGILKEYEENRSKKKDAASAQQQFHGGVAARVRQFKNGYRPRIRSAPVVPQKYDADKVNGLLT